MAFAIDEPGKRRRLDVRAKPYFVRLSDGLHLGYRKGKIVSRWVVRRAIDGRYRTRTIRDVEPDDERRSDGIRFLDYQQMVERLMTDTIDDDGTDQKKAAVACSFCGKDHTRVAKLVAGPGVYICDACVALCQIYIDHPDEDGKLLIDDGRAVLRDGAPVFVPLTAEERAARDALKGS